uniref:Uncharacterized protein n=1 Tax=Knipowitschia caucasica TaxID=637954 RepID=A0AAV2JI01_KNICA
MNDEEEKQAMAQRIKELENELAVLRAASSDSETPSTSTGGTSGASALPMRQAPVIYVQQDRKLPLFSGKLDEEPRKRSVHKLCLIIWRELRARK